MNVEPTQQPTTDDPELAKVLAGNDDTAQQATSDDSAQSGLQFEEAPMPTGESVTEEQPTEEVTPVDSTGLDSAINELAQATPPEAPAPEQTPDPTASVATPTIPAPVGELEDIKKDALGELRPLVDKLTLPADEKFDIMLLIIRSTDDQSLVASAHAAAKEIQDETKRAQALLDVVKEIDYFAGGGQGQQT